MSIGLLILRVGVGGILAAHGLQKLMGWFGGPGIEGATGFMGSLGFRPARGHAWLGALAETVGGLLLVLGLLTPLGAAAVIGMMITAAVVVHRPNGFFNQSGGYEFPLALAVAAAGLAFTGAGRYSLDNVIGWHLWGWRWGTAALVVGVVASVIAQTTRSAAPAAAAPAAPEEREQTQRAA